MLLQLRQYYEAKCKEFWRTEKLTTDSLSQLHNQSCLLIGIALYSIFNKLIQKLERKEFPINCICRFLS